MTGLVLPPASLHPRFEVIKLQEFRSRPFTQRLPRRWVETHGAPQNSDRCSRCMSQRVSFQLLCEAMSRVHGENHQQTVGPTCPVCRDTDTGGAPETHPSRKRPTLANPVLPILIQSVFGRRFWSGQFWPKPILEGGAPNGEGWGAPKGGPKGGGPKFCAFFSLSHGKFTFFFFFPSLLVFSWNFGV